MRARSNAALLGFVFAMACLALPGLTRAQSFPVVVSATANIYGAGQPAPPAPGGNGAGVLPIRIDLPVGTGRVVTFDSITGSVDFGGCCAPNGPDGVSSVGTGAGNSWDGISGMTIARGRFLSAVFLDDAEPADPPPGPLTISDIDFASLSPSLRQTFFVGDGLTGEGSGAVQVFDVPDGATRLFLGLHDAGPPDPTLPGWYGDNSGSFSGTVIVSGASSVPGLGPAGALALVLLLVGSARQFAREG